MTKCPSVSKNSYSPSSPSPEQISDAITDTDGGIILMIEVTTGSKNATFPDGYNPWRKTLRISVKAPPVEGKANKAIIELISDRIGCPANTISILSGHTSTHKKIKILNLSRHQFIRWYSQQSGDTSP